MTFRSLFHSRCRMWHDRLSPVRLPLCAALSSRARPPDLLLSSAPEIVAKASLLSALAKVFDVSLARPKRKRELIAIAARNRRLDCR
jgi:hypothetical protein